MQISLGIGTKKSVQMCIDMSSVQEKGPMKKNMHDAKKWA